MASNKNQHFVPKAYLRPLASDNERSTNVHIISRDLAKHNVSIKDQCSRHNFYGNDEPIEDFIQFFEGRYGGVMSRLDNNDLKVSDIFTLFRFFVLQHMRTPHQLGRRNELADAFRNTVIGGKALHEVREDAREPVDAQREMQQQLYIAAKSNDYLHDLEPVLLVNRTKIPFITSHNPANIMNRLYSQRYADDTCGIVQSGLCIILPLTPRVAFFAYDRDVYGAFKSSPLRHEIRKERDVDRLNEIQAQMATHSLYFSDWQHARYVANLANRCLSMRRDQWSRIWTGIKFEENAEHEAYRAVKRPGFSGGGFI